MCNVMYCSVLYCILLCSCWERKWLLCDVYVRCTQLNSTQLLSLVEKVRDTTRDLEVLLLPMTVLFCNDAKSLKSIPGARTLTCTTGTSNLEWLCVMHGNTVCIYAWCRRLFQLRFCNFRLDYYYLCAASALSLLINIPGTCTGRDTVHYQVHSLLLY